MPNVVVILPTQSYRAADFIRAGEELGIDLVVASEVAPPLEMGDRYIKINCDDPDAAARSILEFGDRVTIDGMVAADDGGVIVAALAGSELGLLANNPEAAYATRDKVRMRHQLRKGEVPQPDFAVLGDEDSADETADSIGFPLVVKPVSRSAGQGVMRVDGPELLESVIARVRGILEGIPVEDTTLILESFLVGDEVSLEGIVSADGLMTLAIFDKPDPIPGDGFEETILVTPSRHSLETQKECERVAAAAVTAIGLSHGPVHIEMMISGDQVSVIEVAARSIGGLCSRSLSFGLMGTSLESLILRNALGLDKPELRRNSSASGVLMIPIPGIGRLVSVAGLEEVRDIDGITGIELSARPGDALAPPPEGSRYLGFVFARADTPAAVETALKTARARIVVTVE